MPTAESDAALLAVADALEARQGELLDANAADLERMGSDDARYDRLLLTPARIADIAEGIRNVAALPSPLGITLESIKRPNGMLIRKVSVSFGVIGAIFEARPNVIFDIFALCFKAGSACVLKGGHEAADSDAKAIEIIRDALAAAGAPVDAAVLLPPTHEAAARLLEARGEVDLLIPRGSRKLIDFVRDNARVPVIETGAGVCHTYFHTSGDIATGRDIIFNAKTRRVGVCNALDCLVVDRDRLESLPTKMSKYMPMKRHITLSKEPIHISYRLRKMISAASGSTTNSRCARYRGLTRRLSSLAATVRTTPSVSWPKTARLRSASWHRSMRPAYMQMCRRPLPTAHSSASVPR